LISFIIPWREGLPWNEPKGLGPGDELIVVREARGAGEVWKARVKGAHMARNPWLIHGDSDAQYPLDHVEKVRRVIKSGKYEVGFRTRRVGGFGPAGNVEASLVVRRDYFLEKTAGFKPAPLAVDIGVLFKNLPVEETITYRHGFTGSEKMGIIAAGIATLLLLGS